MLVTFVQVETVGLNTCLGTSPWSGSGSWWAWRTLRLSSAWSETGFECCRKRPKRRWGSFNYTSQYYIRRDKCIKRSVSCFPVLHINCCNYQAAIVQSEETVVVLQSPERADSDILIYRGKKEGVRTKQIAKCPSSVIWGCYIIPKLAKEGQRGWLKKSC